MKHLIALAVVLLLAFYAYNRATALPNDSYVKIPDNPSPNPSPNPTETPAPTHTSPAPPTTTTDRRVKPAADWYIGFEVVGETKDGRTVTLYRKTHGLFYAGTGNVPSYQYDLESVSLIPTIYVKDIHGQRSIKIVDIYGYLTTCSGARIRIPGQGAPSVVVVDRKGKFPAGASVTIDESTLMQYLAGTSCKRGVLSLNVVIQTDTGYAFGYKASIFVKVAEADGQNSQTSTNTQTSTSTSTSTTTTTTKPPSPPRPPMPKPIYPLFERIIDVSLEPLGR